MSDLKNFVKKIAGELIKKEYPHIIYPGAVMARIIRKKSSDVSWTYVIRVLDRHGNIDETIPELPDVICDQEYDVGDEVVVVLLYGQMQPYIVGRCICETCRYR